MLTFHRSPTHAVLPRVGVVCAFCACAVCVYVVYVLCMLRLCVCVACVVLYMCSHFLNPNNQSLMVKVIYSFK